MICSDQDTVLSGIEGVPCGHSPATTSRFPFNTQTSARSRGLDESLARDNGTATLPEEVGTREMTAELPHQSNNQCVAHNHAAQQGLVGDVMVC